MGAHALGTCYAFIVDSGNRVRWGVARLRPHCWEATGEDLTGSCCPERRGTSEVPGVGRAAAEIYGQRVLSPISRGGPASATAG